MLSLVGLYQRAEHNGISVDDFPLKKRAALAVLDNIGGCHIAIDRRRLENRADEKYKLAHEMGHCVTGALYSRNVPFETIERCEERANRWAIENCLPLDEIKIAMRAGLTEAWQLAEWYDLPEGFVHKALQYYSEAKGVDFTALA